MDQATIIERRLRIITGLILAAYIILHLSNHSIGLISLQVMDGVREVLTAFWRSIVGQILLYGSLITHFLLALFSLYRRKTLKLPKWELFQLVFGLCLIPLLAGHIAATWGTRTFLEAELTYTSVLTFMFSENWFWIRQYLLVFVAWVHVCIGLHFFLRLFGAYRKIAIFLYPLAIILPVAAIVSISQTASDLKLWNKAAPKVDSYGSGYGSDYGDDYSSSSADSYSSDYGSSYGNDYGSGGDDYSYGTQDAPSGLTPEEKLANRTLFHNSILAVFWGGLLLTLLLRRLRIRKQIKNGTFELRLASGRVLKMCSGNSILETLRFASISHASICGGRGRCTTCRVRVNEVRSGSLPEASPLEREALTRINADPNVRLACQCRPNCDLDVTPLVASEVDVQTSLKRAEEDCDERNVLAMFIDLRGSTKLAEQKMPFDILFILNLFMKEMSEAISESGGHYSQFAGDGGMALYGLNGDTKQGARNALKGALDMKKRLNRINKHLEMELEEPLKMGIGIHCGEAIVGMMGPPTAPNLTAIGDNINIAARLEGQAGLLSCELVISSEVATSAEIDFSKFLLQKVKLKGKRKSIEIHAIENLETIEALL